MLACIAVSYSDTLKFDLATVHRVQGWTIDHSHIFFKEMDIPPKKVKKINDKM